jgi:hypothetical protein
MLDMTKLVTGVVVELPTASWRITQPCLGGRSFNVVCLETSNSFWEPGATGVFYPEATDDWKIRPDKSKTFQDLYIKLSR